ncbi:MAG: DUF3825 domain-containing protein [Planctomycetota bacterium]
MPPAGDRKTGTVERVLGDYGFISSEETPEQELYFKASWFRGSPPLKEGELVTFQLKVFGTNVQAHYLDRATEQAPDATATVPRPPGRPSAPSSERLFEWAYLGYIPNVLAALKGLALDERWEFKNTPPNSDRPFPILYSYLVHTFGRLALEQKVLVNAGASIAALNTGLVDPRYEPIHALFVPNDNPRAPWQLAGFCIAGEGADGQNLVRHFAPLPSTAHYFDNQMDLLYDTRAGKPELDWHHIIIERIDRYPADFIKDHWPPVFQAQDVSLMSDDERKAYYRDLGNAIEQDSRTYRRIMNRVKDAIDLSIKRVQWNFKTAIPTYYPRVRKLQLLLPVCLLSDEEVDMALAVEKTQSGSYLGHTVLPLDWAYKNARLVCRPDSDWLAPQDISAEGDEDEA